MAVKVNFTLPEDVVEHLRAQVGERSRSAFVAQAGKEQLQQIERAQLEAELIEGYKARFEEDREVNAEWEAATLEGWPEA